ncbi:MAG TPA: hypothetical protein VG892_04035 [Terriglobales bacterium]|nr:hypothetical protein [Terriglobales bacterium]
MRRVCLVFLVLAGAMPMWAESPATSSQAASQETAGILNELKQLVAAQQLQLKAADEELRAQRRLLEAQRSQLEAQHRDILNLSAAVGDLSGASRAGVVSPAGVVRPANLGEIASSSPVLPAGSMPVPQKQGTATPLLEPGTEKPSPLSFRIGGTEFLPLGFVDFTSVFRSTNVGSGIGTAFGAIPLSNTPAGHLTENRFSAQNSRIGLRVTGTFGKNDLTGYLETDFLGNAPPNLFVTSNSATNRLRLYWVDVKRGKWEFLAGQSWSWLTPNRNGVSPMPADIFFSQNMDTNYQVGLTWTRAPQVRAIYHPNKNWALGVALEDPEQFVGNAVTFPTALNSVYPNELSTGAATTTPNLHPDIIPKIAYDATPGGRHLHLEAVGLLTSFRVYNPLTNASSTATGGGGSLNGNYELTKNLKVLFSSFYSSGGGRYIFGLGPDLVVRPNGTPALVAAGSGIAGLEWQAGRNTLVYAYYGAAYFRRHYFLDTNNTFEGFGFPGSSTNANRSIQEPTFGITETLWKNPNYGAMQLITQYSYLTRSPWTATPAHAHSNMGFVDLRYVLP